MDLKFRISGMTCAACSARVEKVAAAVPGVVKAEVNLLAGTLLVESENDSCTTRIIADITNAGYGAEIYGQEKKHEKKTEENPLKQMKIRIIGSGVCLLILMYFTMYI